MKIIKIIFLCLITSSSNYVFAQTGDSDVLEPVQKQLEGYNNRDIDLFMEAYADSVKVFMFPDQLLYQGSDRMRSRYDMMFQTQLDLHAEITNRIVMGNTVIDREKVTFSKNAPQINAIAIYKVRNKLIYEVYFIRED